MTTVNPSNEFKFSGLTLYADQRKLFNADNTEINLSSRAFDTLLVLVQHRGETLSKAFLMKAIWPAVVVEENNLNQAISSLRKALGDSKNKGKFIQTVPGRGYVFVAELENIETTNPDNANADDKTKLELNTNQKKSSQEKTEALAPTITRKSPPYSRISFALILSIVVLGFFIYVNTDAELPESSTLSSTTTLNEEITAALDLIPNSIAVLPFTNLNPNAENELFSIGLHDEIINQLSKIRSLKVISRDSIIALSEQHQSTNDLGAKLQVESIMTGTILFVEERARVSLQMIEPRTGVTLWTTTYDADTTDLSNMISIQSDIAMNVGLALEAEINHQELLAMEAIPTESFEAYRYNLAARNAYYVQDFEQTWILTQQALELDPNYLDALYNFSYVNTVLTAVPLPGISSQKHAQLALEAAEKIIAIAPDKTEGYTLRASALSNNKEWEKVAVEVKRLKNMGASLADMKFYAIILLCLGDFEGAIEILEANLMIEPVNLYGRGFLLSAFELSGQRSLARQEYQLGSELNPEWWGNTVNLFLALGRKEPLDVEILPVSEELKYTLSRIDDKDYVISRLEKYSNQNNKSSAEAVYYGSIAAYTGENELAIEFMRIALNDAWLSFHWLWLPVFDEARQLDSFHDLLKESGIVDYWKNNGWPEVCQPAGDSFTCDWQAYPEA